MSQVHVRLLQKASKLSNKKSNLLIISIFMNFMDVFNMTVVSLSEPLSRQYINNSNTEAYKICNKINCELTLTCHRIVPFNNNKKVVWNEFLGSNSSKKILLFKGEK